MSYWVCESRPRSAADADRLGQGRCRTVAKRNSDTRAGDGSPPSSGPASTSSRRPARSRSGSSSTCRGDILDPAEALAAQAGVADGPGVLRAAADQGDRGRAGRSTRSPRSRRDAGPSKGSTRSPTTPSTWPSGASSPRPARRPPRRPGVRAEHRLIRAIESRPRSASSDIPPADANRLEIGPAPDARDPAGRSGPIESTSMRSGT